MLESQGILSVRKSGNPGTSTVHMSERMAHVGATRVICYFLILTICDE